MRISMLLAGAVVALGVSAASVPAFAAPSVPEFSARQSLIEPASHWRGHRWGGWRRCGYWRRECGDRWGWGGRGYRRCLWRHCC